MKFRPTLTRMTLILALTASVSVRAQLAPPQEDDERSPPLLPGGGPGLSENPQTLAHRLSFEQLPSGAPSTLPLDWMVIAAVGPHAPGPTGKEVPKAESDGGASTSGSSPSCQAALTRLDWGMVQTLKAKYASGALPSRLSLKKAAPEAQLAALWVVLERSGTYSLLPVDQLLMSSRGKRELEFVLNRIAQYFKSKKPITERRALALMEDLVQVRLSQTSRTYRYMDGLLPHDSRALSNRVLEQAALTDGWSTLARQIGWQADRKLLDKLSHVSRSLGIDRYLGFRSARSFSDSIKKSFLTSTANGLIGNVPPIEFTRINRVSTDMSRLIIEKGGVNQARLWIAANPTSALAKELVRIERFVHVENAWRAARTTYLSWRVALLVQGGIQFVQMLNENQVNFNSAKDWLLGLESRQKERAKEKDRYLAEHPELRDLYDWAKNQVELRGRSPDPSNPDDLEEYQMMRELLKLPTLSDQDAKAELNRFLKQVDLWGR